MAELGWVGEVSCLYHMHGKFISFESVHKQCMIVYLSCQVVVCRDFADGLRLSLEPMIAICM